MSNVVSLSNDTSLDIDPETVLSGLLDDRPDEVLIISYMQDGKLSVRSSHSDVAGLLLMLELAKARLMANAEEMLAADRGDPAPVIPFPGNPCP